MLTNNLMRNNFNFVVFHPPKVVIANLNHGGNTVDRNTIVAIVIIVATAAIEVAQVVAKSRR